MDHVNDTGSSLATRYGTVATGRRVIAIGLAAVLVLSASAWLGWATLFHADPAVASRAIAHDIVDDHTVTVTAGIEYGDGPVAATCAARAIAEDKTVVGEVTFRPAADARTQTVEFATDRRATTVDWLGCTAPGQPRPR